MSKKNEIPSLVKLPETVKRTILEADPHCTLVKMVVKAGTIPPKHQHPHDQIDYMLEGSAEIALRDKIVKLHPGESLFIPGGTLHQFLVSEEDQVFLEFFTPGREDINQEDQT